MATTYNNLYLDTRKRLRAHGVEMAQLEARELVCFAADKTREQFFRDLPLYASKEVENRVEELTERRLAGEPVAYIIGEWEFYGLPLDISRDVIIPRSDTETLAERAILLAKAAGEGARVLDLCAGSGCVGLAVAANAPNCRVVLADLSEGALRVCKQNVRRNSLNARVTCVQADALAAPSASLWDFDVIVCNPPYGERIEEKENLPALYREIGERFAALDAWSMYLITSYEDAQKYIGRKADKNRKIYNGMLKTYFYQFMGPKPPRRSQENGSN